MRDRHGRHRETEALQRHARSRGGDRIIGRVARLLQEQARSDDLVARKHTGAPPPELHSRFGGDEFCFLIPRLEGHEKAYAISERFREAVERYDWTLEDRQLAEQPVRIDVGVVGLQLGRVAERRFIASRLASDLINRADTLLYKAKHDPVSRIRLGRASARRLVPIPAVAHAEVNAPGPRCWPGSHLRVMFCIRQRR